MRFEIDHLTTYAYPQPVRLDPHDLRLRPREGHGQRLRLHRLEVTPEPARWDDQTDALGNAVVRMWFAGETQKFAVRSIARVDVQSQAPTWADELDPEARKVPFVTTGSGGDPLATYRQPARYAVRIRQLAEDERQAARGVTLAFLDAVAQRLRRDVRQVVREKGGPRSPDETLARGMGACRDLAVAMIEACRGMGMAARFVSGYQEGRPEQKRYLHAWIEVFLPGLGWRAWDPSAGGRVEDRHIAVAHAAQACDTTPILGHFWGPKLESEMHAEISLRAVSDDVAG
jgi:transglutaminase-like putative cysteine protease